MSLKISEAKIGADGSAVFANSAAANTVMSIALAKPTGQTTKEHLVEIWNPNITIEVCNVALVFGGGTRDVVLDTFTVPKGKAIAKLIIGLFSGCAGKIKLTNVTALGAAETFTAASRIREI